MNPVVWLVSRRLTELAGPWDERLTTSGDDDGEYVCRAVAGSAGVHFVENAKCYYRIGNVGSLNWNMEKSDKSLGALVLSLKLSIGHLLVLEDSERTRNAAIRYLHHFLPYFYGAPEQPFRELAEFADTLGGGLKPPKAGWKYYPLEMAFGSRVTRKFINNWRAAKMLARGKWDRYLYRLTR